MTGLRSHERDAALVEAGGDGALRPLLPEELERLISEELATGDLPRIEEVRWDYARWKPGTSVTGAYGVSFADGTEEIVVAKRYADGKPRLLEQRESPDQAPEPDQAQEPDQARDLGGAGRGALLRPRAVLAASGLVLWTPPGDRLLPGLDRVSDTRLLARRLEELGVAPERTVRRRRLSTELLRYKPERRAVWRVDASVRAAPPEKRRVALRVLEAGEAERVLALRSALEEHGAAKELVPALVGGDPRGWILESWLELEPGDPSAPDSFDHAPRAGALLAALHGLPAPRVGPRPTEDSHGLVDFQELRPLFAVDPLLAALARRLEGLRASTERRSWIHGDLHPDQVVPLAGGGSFRLLDLDLLRPGDPCEDLASWIADRLVAEPGVGLREAADPLLEGYAGGGAEIPDENRLAFHVACGLVRRAAGIVRRLEHDAVALASGALERALEVDPSRSAGE